MPFKLLGQFITLTLLAGTPVMAQTNMIKFQSAPERTALLELYTSEGCSSCPPTEAWLSGLKNSPRLWKDFAPVAFHVDYWNSLGWKDAWSDAEFSERQRSYAQLWHSDNIYTPELVLNGKEWHNWFTGNNGSKSDGKKVGVLTVTSGDTKFWRVNFNPEKNPNARYEIHAALLAGGIVSNVNAGENNGRRLEHDFVVMSLLQIGMTTSDGVANGRFVINAAKSNAGTTRALVVWVSLADEIQPMQATGGWLIAPGKN
jgi:hypothetical protein